MLDPSTGLINSWLRQMPFAERAQLRHLFVRGDCLGFTWFPPACPTKVMLLTPAFRRMDASMEEASRMSGASAFTTLVADHGAGHDAGDRRCFPVQRDSHFQQLRDRALARRAVELLRLFDENRRSGAAGAAAGEPSGGVGQHHSGLSRGVYSAPAQIDYTPPIHHRDRSVQTQDHRSRRMALSGDGFCCAGHFRPRRGAAVERRWAAAS